MVKIIADSTCDLSEELIKKYDISILPLHILLGEEEYEDGKTITPEEIFAWSNIGSEKWFKANVYQITVRKSLLSDAQRALLDQEPLPMKLWDPLA